MKGFDFDHPVFDPLWVRVVVVLLCLGWGGFEVWNGTYGWAALFTGLGLVAGHHFFVVKLHRGDDR